MKYRIYQIFPAHPMVFLCLILFGFSGAANTAKLYKWTDENGNVRYGDQLPASESKKKHQTLNSQGVVVSTTEAAKTPEEYAAIRKAEKERKAKELAEEREKNLQRRKDRVLLTTYGSVYELELVKDKRIKLVDTVIQSMYRSKRIAEKRLEMLETDARTRYLDKGLEVPGGLAQNIEMVTHSNQVRQKRLRLRLVEKKNILTQYEKDLARYRKLTGQYPESPNPNSD